MELNEQQLQRIVDKAVQKALDANVKHWCFTCSHFRFRPVTLVDGKKRGGVRVCQCVEELTVKAGICQNWMLEPDHERRVKRFC